MACGVKQQRAVPWLDLQGVAYEHASEPSAMSNAF